MKTADNYSARKLAGGGGRVGYIDALKGLAILCVVLGHVLGKFFEGALFAEADTAMFGVLNLVYAFHMPLFMMLSGYVYCEAYPIDRNPAKRSKLYQQIGNLAALYVINSITFGLFKFLFNSSGFVKNNVKLADVLMILFKPINGNCLWYLYVLIIVYCLFSLKPLRQIDRRILLCILSALSLLSGWTAVEAFQLSKVMFYALFFYMGMMIHEQPEWFVWKNGGGIFVTSLIAIILCAAFWHKGADTKEAEDTMLKAVPIVNVLVGLSISLSLWQIFQNLSVLAENRFLKTIGQYSLEIYMIHDVFTSTFKILLPRLGVTNAVLGTLISFTVSTAIPVLFALFTKRLKIHDLLFRPVTYFAGRRAQKGHA